MEEQMTMVEKYLDQMVNFGFEYGPKLIGGILVLIFGLWISRIITKGVGKALTRGNIDSSLIPFIKNLTSVILKILVVITVMGMIGIQMTSFIAILGAAGLAIGMALSGTLQNFAGGVIILIFKPFKVGDFIEAQGYMGTVKEISIFTTRLNTVDKKLIIIPNGPLSTGSLTNFSAEPQRRVDWTFGIAYGDDIGNFKKAIQDFIAEDSRILKDPAPFIGLTELADSSVNFAVRVWVNSPDYWDVFYQMNEKVYQRFGDYKLNIPFPQMDVHLHNNQ
ncbi:MAG: mechanosensitive ion channel domain-containing protein [Bacteroidales bacterium]|jgi:small conductance mechanosensitive channel|nr:mechanosensitive ion channel domain-containing protein [Bacteroidales bacterium]